MDIQNYDAIIIGAGQGGVPLATDLAKAGWKTALIERRYVGGACINTACTPTKTMVASARTAYLARRAEDFGINVSGVQVDMRAVRARKREIVEQSRGSTEKRIDKAEGLDLIRGEARFTGDHELTVTLNGSTGEQKLKSDVIVIDTGTHPRPLPIDGIASVPLLDEESIMELDEVPEHLLIIGGGYVGLEFGQMFRRFGAEVTIIQHSARLLEKEDEDIADAVTEILREDGIEILLNAQAQSAVRGADGKGIRLTLKMEDGDTREITGSHLLGAVGRAPNTKALDLDKGGIERTEHGYVKTNEFFETSVEGIYAIGDVRGDAMFTHVSYDDYRYIKARLLNGERRSHADRLIPYTMFIDPQLGRVGLTERAAREQYASIKVSKMPMSYVARAFETGETRGLMKAVIDAETDQILGCAILGIEGGELMGALQIAMMGKLPYTVLRDATFAHPTLIESLNNLFMRIE